MTGYVQSHLVVGAALPAGLARLSAVLLLLLLRR